MAHVLQYTLQVIELTVPSPIKATTHHIFAQGNQRWSNQFGGLCVSVCVSSANLHCHSCTGCYGLVKSAALMISIAA